MSRYGFILAISLLGAPGIGLCQIQSDTSSVDSRTSDMVKNLANDILDRAYSAENDAYTASENAKPEEVQIVIVYAVSEMLRGGIKAGTFSADDAKSALAIAARDEDNEPNVLAALNMLISRFDVLTVPHTASKLVPRSCPSCKTGG